MPLSIFQNGTRRRSSGTFSETASAASSWTSARIIIRTEATLFISRIPQLERLAIDAKGEFAHGYRDNRPKTMFFNFFVSDKSDEQADFYIVRDPGHLTKSTAVAEFVRGRKTEKVKVLTITLTIFSEARRPKDRLPRSRYRAVEPHALAGFDIEKYRPDLSYRSSPPSQRSVLAYLVLRLCPAGSVFPFRPTGLVFHSQKSNYQELSDVPY